MHFHYTLSLLQSFQNFIWWEWVMTKLLTSNSSSPRKSFPLCPTGPSGRTDRIKWCPTVASRLIPKPLFSLNLLTWATWKEKNHHNFTIVSFVFSSHIHILCSRKGSPFSQKLPKPYRKAAKLWNFAFEGILISIVSRTNTNARKQSDISTLASAVPKGAEDRWRTVKTTADKSHT